MYAMTFCTIACKYPAIPIMSMKFKKHSYLLLSIIVKCSPNWSQATPYNISEEKRLFPPPNKRTKARKIQNVYGIFKCIGHKDVLKKSIHTFSEYREKLTFVSIT